MKDKTGPAFPSNESAEHIAVQGMTYRQWLIGMALQGTLFSLGVDTANAATYAVQSADAVLEILDEELAKHE
jgi:hypothetical protein